MCRRKYNYVTITTSSLGINFSYKIGNPAYPSFYCFFVFLFFSFFQSCIVVHQLLLVFLLLVFSIPCEVPCCLCCLSCFVCVLTVRCLLTFPQININNIKKIFISHARVIHTSAANTSHQTERQYIWGLPRYHIHTIA